MKVAYLNPFNDGTGYAGAGIRTMLAMDKVGIDVYPVEIKFASQVVPAPNRIQLLASKTAKDVDIVVQHFLPPAFQYVKGAKNIGFFHLETTNFLASGWQYYANLLDEVWVSCQDNVKACKESGIKVPIHCIPLGQDFNSYTKQDPLVLPNKTAFTFYTISDWSERKNVEAVIKSYLCAFNQYDNVKLIIKCYVDGKSPEDSKQIIIDRIKQIKESLRLFKDPSHYPPIHLITEYLSDNSIQQLHQTGDCCVFAERHTAWNLVAFDALIYGNALIINGYGGHTDFTTKCSQYVEHTNYMMERVSGMQHCPYTTLYTAKEEWANPSTNHMIEQMQKIYNDFPKGFKVDRKEELKDFTLEAVGASIKEILNG